MDNETFTAYIYQIYDHWDGLRYIGSTTKDVKQRLRGHESEFKKYQKGKYGYVTSFAVLGNGDYDVSILERVNVSSVKELRQYERKYIESIKCVNKNIPLRLKHESSKIYYENNKNDILIKQSEYYQKNKDYIKEYKHQYNKLNKDKISEQRNQKQSCVCGGKYSLRNKAQHLKSNKHQTYERLSL
jgi:predicted ribonuclease YlaK